MSDTGAEPHGYPTAAPKPAPVHEPEITVWPATLALGITLLALSVVTHPVFAALGAAMGIAALVGWIRELCHA